MKYVVGIDGYASLDEVAEMLTGAEVGADIGSGTTEDASALSNVTSELNAAMKVWKLSLAQDDYVTKAVVLPEKREIMRLKLAAADFKPVIWFRAPASADDLRMLGTQAGYFRNMRWEYDRCKEKFTDNTVFDMRWDGERERLRQLLIDWEVGCRRPAW